MDFEHGSKARKAVWNLHKNVYKVPGSYSENRNLFFKPSPASTTSKEREFMVDSGASLHVMLCNQRVAKTADLEARQDFWSVLGDCISESCSKDVTLFFRRTVFRDT